MGQTNAHKSLTILWKDLIFIPKIMIIFFIACHKSDLDLVFKVTMITENFAI